MMQREKRFIVLESGMSESEGKCDAEGGSRAVVCGDRHQVASAGAGATPSAGAGATPSAGAGAEAGSSPTSAVSGGSCSVSGGKNPLSAFALAAALGAVVLRRRRRG